MAELLVACAIILSFSLVLITAKKKSWYIEFPNLFAAACFFWLGPQLVTTIPSPTLPESGKIILLAFVLCSVVMVYAGFAHGYRIKKDLVESLFIVNRPVTGANEKYRSKLLPNRVLGVSIFGLMMWLLVMAQPDSVRASSTWSGPITILYFFSQVSIVGFAAGLWGYLNEKSRKYFYAVCLGAAPLIINAIIFFRRAEILELICILVGFLYFKKRRKFNFVLGLIVLVFIVLLNNNIDKLRFNSGAYQLGQTGQLETKILSLDDLLSIEWRGFYKPEDIDPLEAINAIYFFSASSERDFPGFGSELWNSMIFAYVPAQLVGSGVKRSLMSSETVGMEAMQRYGHVSAAGATATGFSYAYFDWWIFGIFIYWIVGFIFGRLQAFGELGSDTASILYVSLLVIGLHTITHTAYYLFINAPIIIVALSLCKNRTRYRWIRSL